MASWTFDLSPVWLFGGFVGAVLGAGHFLTRMVMGNEEAAKKAIANMEKEAKDQQKAQLDELAERLKNTSDERDNNLLADLRELSQAFSDHSLWPDEVSPSSSIEIITGVQELFQRSVQSLQRSATLAEMAAKLNSPQAQKPMLEERERLLNDVGLSVQQLTKVFTQLQSLHTSEGVDSDLSGIREELDQSLAIASEVQERMAKWKKQYAQQERKL